MPPQRPRHQGRKRCSCRWCLADPKAPLQTSKTIRAHILRQEQEDLRWSWKEPTRRIPGVSGDAREAAYTMLDLGDGACRPLSASLSLPDALLVSPSLPPSQLNETTILGSEHSVSDLSGDAESIHSFCSAEQLELASDSDSDSDLGELSSDDDSYDLLGDPLYASAEAIFDCEDDLAALALGDTEVWKVPLAFSEHPALRKAYIDAFIASTFHGVTEEGIKHMLNSTYEDLLAFSVRSGAEIPGLKGMARTLRTAERRLGIDPDELLVYYFLCDRCFGRHHPTSLRILDSPLCPTPDCGGCLYTTKVLANGKSKRTPTRIFPVTPISTALERYLTRPQKLIELNKWRQEGDEPGRNPPHDSIPRPTADDFRDPDIRVTDVFEALGWRTIQAGLERRRGGKWGIEDVDVQQLHQRFVSLPYGLVFQIFVDWFCPLKKSWSHSSGAVYVTIVNNPRAIRFNREDTFLYCLMPGPNEPSLEQINGLLEPLVDNMLKLGTGMEFDIGDGEPVLVHGTLWTQISDLPASRKASGLRAVTTEKFMCTECEATVSSLASPDCFDPCKFRYRDDNRFLKYAYRARNAEPERREEIADERGARWSVLDKLPGFNPARNSPVDFMHAAYLGEAKHVLQVILVGNGMFQSRSAFDAPAAQFEEFLANVWYPSSIGRLPKKVLSGTKLKADQLRYLAALLPVALYHAWQIDGQIPDMNAPSPRRGTKAHKKQVAREKLLLHRRTHHVLADPDHSAQHLEGIKAISTVRNYLQHYNVILDWSASLRIMGSQSFTPGEIARAGDFHSDACQAWVRMGCHLTPNFHLLCHEPSSILRIGPVYGWWGFPYERHNGFLGGIKNNGHVKGEMEATMMRGWTKHQLIFDLMLRLENLKAPTMEDTMCLKKLKRLIRGPGPGSKRQRGTLLNLLANLQAVDRKEIISFTSRGSKTNLHRAEPRHYMGVLAVLQELWKDVVQLTTHTAPLTDPGEPFIATAVELFANVVVRGIQFGAATSHRGRSCMYAYIDGRQPVLITHIYRIKHRPRHDPESAELEAVCIVVQRFIADDALPLMPWHHRAVDLGIGTWYADMLGDIEVIDAARLCGQFALATVEAVDDTGPLWITVSLCHTEEEPDTFDDSDIPDLMAD